MIRCLDRRGHGRGGREITSYDQIEGACVEDASSPGAAGDAELRPHTRDDYEALRELWAAEEDGSSLGLSAADDRSAILGFLERNPELSLGLWESGRLVGSILVGEDGRRGYLYHAVVRPSMRRRGYGRLLVAEALRGLQARGIQKVHVMVYEANQGGREFWRRIGFAPRDELVVLSREIADRESSGDGRGGIGTSGDRCAGGAEATPAGG